MIDYDEAKPVIVELARRTARVFEHATFAAFLEKWANPPDDPAEEKALVAEYHMFRVAFEGLVRPAEAVEGRVVGSDYALALRTASHLVGMLAAAALAHVGRVMLKSADHDRRRHRVATVFFGLSLLAMLASIPWPGGANARPLFRF